MGADIGGSLGSGGLFAVPDGVKTCRVDVHGVPVDVHGFLLLEAGQSASRDSIWEYWNGLISIPPTLPKTAATKPDASRE
jgi:hypothetical protein